MLHDPAIFQDSNGQSLKWWNENRHIIETGSIEPEKVNDYTDFVENCWLNMCIGKVRLFESEV